MTAEEKAKLRRLVREVYELREYHGCHLDREGGDCGNWPSCPDECPLRGLGILAGIKPQENGEVDR